MRNVSFLHQFLVVALVLGFIGAGWSRLNDCDLFNPDSPRYLIYSQSIANSGQYRAIDMPGAPLYTWRPPGLSILMAPILKFLPYDIVAGKWVVLTTGALLLVVVHLLASSRGTWNGPLMMAVVGSSPFFLSLSTEVLTEVPYALGILAVIYWIGVWNSSKDTDGLGPYCGVLLALAFTPIIRTVAVALVVAVGIWCLTSRRRLKFLPAIGLAVLGLGWLAWRSRLSPGSNYAGSILQTIREQGLPTVVSNALTTLEFYARAFPGVLLPGLTSDQPFYAPMVVGSLPTLNGLYGTMAIIAATITVLGLLGMWSQRSRGGIVALLYLPLYIACLSIWPWRHERFLWPLIPLIWAFAPAGAIMIGGRLPKAVGRFLTLVILTALAALVAWQSYSDAALIGTNCRYLANREAFFREEAPGFYFGGWRKAGEWIRANTAPHARLLTWQAAVGGTAHRFQRRVQFEAMTPERLHQQIASFSSRYLVVNDSQFGLGFAWQQVSADPAYRLKTVYRDQNVAVLEVEPNRTGIVSRSAYTEWLAVQQTLLDAVLSRQPDRADLLTRKADLLQESGQNAEAITLLEGLVGRGMVTVRVCSTLGWLYFDERRYELAAKTLELASGLPNAESIAESLIEGVQLARTRLSESATEATEPPVEKSIRRLKGLVAAQRLSQAETLVKHLIEQSPEVASVQYWRGYLHDLFHETTQARLHYQRAVTLGSQEASAKLGLLRLSKAFDKPSDSIKKDDGDGEVIDLNKYETHVRFAAMLDEHGWSGRAVAVLESARDRFGDQTEILSKLADLYQRFARPEDAAPLYELALKERPHEKSLKQGLANAKAGLQVPKF